MNFDRIQWHRPVIHTALALYAKQLAKVKKGEEDAEVSTKATDERLAIVMELQEEFGDEREKLLEGTPMGDSMSDLRYQDTDGTILTVDRLDERLMSVGVDVPVAQIGEWTFAQRQEARRWADARRDAVLAGHTIGAVAIPEFILRAWITDRDGLLERAMPDSEVEEWIDRGPWGARTGDATRDDAWQVYSPEITMDALDDARGPVTERAERVHAGEFTLARAWLIAANLNAIEEGKAVTGLANVATIHG